MIGGEHGGAYSWDSPIKTYDDMKKMSFPQVSVDYNTTEKLLDIAKSTFGDYLDVRIHTNWWWTLGLTSTFINLRGLTQFMMDMYDNADNVHKLMAFLRDGTLSILDFYQKNGLLSSNIDGGLIASGGLGYTDEIKIPKNNNITPMDMWGFSESQETSHVSPEMFKEFVFPYQLPLLEKFALNCYGCCEALDNRFDIIKAIPRLRRVSVSPWACLEVMAEKLEDKYVYSMKPDPAHLAKPHIDQDFIRNELRESIRTTKNCCVEIIMKDTNTIAGNPQNVIDWSRMAIEEAMSL